MERRREKGSATVVDEPLLSANDDVTSDIVYVRSYGRSEYPWYNYHYRIRAVGAES